MPVRSRQAAIAAGAALSMVVSATPAAAADGPVTFDAINRRVKALWASDACFAATTHAAIARCWGPEADRASRAQRVSQEIIADIDAILPSTSSYTAVLKTKLNLLTKSGKFCEVRNVDPVQRSHWAQDYSTLFEFANDLVICAADPPGGSVYDDLRGVVAQSFGRFGKRQQVELLKIWYDSYARQFSPKGEMSIVAAAINEQELDSWREFSKDLRHVAVRYGSFPSTVSAAELLAAGKALSRA